MVTLKLSTYLDDRVMRSDLTFPYRNYPLIYYVKALVFNIVYSSSICFQKSHDLKTSNVLQYSTGTGFLQLKRCNKSFIICTLNFSQFESLIPVSHREVAVTLESADEEQQERLVEYQLTEQPQPFVVTQQLRSFPLQNCVILSAGEQDLHGVRAVVQERNTSGGKISSQICHLSLQLGKSYK